VTKAVAQGDLGKKIEVDVKGEILELKITVNSMTDSLRVFAAEVTRCVYPCFFFNCKSDEKVDSQVLDPYSVAREVGTLGSLGGQAKVAGVAGVWKVGFIFYACSNLPVWTTC